MQWINFDKLYIKVSLSLKIKSLNVGDILIKSDTFS